MKGYFLRLLSLALVILLSISVAHTQPIPTTTIIRGGNNEDKKVFELYGCSEGIDFTVYVANLELLSPFGIENLYPLPSNAPALYVHLSISGLYDTIRPIYLFEHSHINNGVNIYKTSINLPLPIHQTSTGFRLTLLKTAAPGDSTINQNHSSGYQLPQGYSFYPIWDYRTPGDLFPCNVTGWTDCYTYACDDISPPPICYSPLPSYSGSYICVSENFNGDNENGIGMIQQDNNPVLQTDKNQTNFEEQSGELKISPNPFTSGFQVQFYALATEVLNIELIDINGKIVQEWEVGTQKGLNNFQLETNDLPSGIYFLKIADDYQSHPKKLIKY